MARKTEVKTVTPEQELHLPDVRSRKAMLQQALEEIRNGGYNAHVAHVTAKAQKGQTIGVADGRGGQRNVQKKDHLKDLEDTIENSKRAAKALDLEIRRLPEEVEPEEDDDDPDISPDDPKE
jgi:hypothetical protein